MSFESFILSNYEISKAGNPRGVRINCPFCDDTKFHGYVNLKHDFFKCFKCNWSHKPDGTATTGYWFLREAHGLPHDEILEILKTLQHAPVLMEEGFSQDLQESVLSLLAEEELEEAPKVVKLKLPESTPLTPGLTSVTGARAWNYWEARMGPAAEEAAAIYKVRYGFTGKYKGRIIVPLYEGSKLVWFQGRAFFPASLEPKYLNPKVTVKSVFGLNLLNEGDGVVICEGIFDAMAVGPGGVAIFGTTLTRHQMDSILKVKPRSITVCLDPDTAGIEGTKRVCSFLRYAGGFCNVHYVIDLPSDPGDLGPDVRRLITERRLSYEHNPELHMM
jgi:uncharacterized protein (DUF3820 family)